MPTPRIIIATPADAAANNGNWRTAQRWKFLLGKRFNTIVQNADTAGRINIDSLDLLIALHARKSAGLIHSLRTLQPKLPVLLVMTGTDLYRDLPINREAQDAVTTADRIVVLQDEALHQLPAAARKKACVIYQSARILKPSQKQHQHLQCTVVGHLRQEKSPETIFELVKRCGRNSPFDLLHIGDGLDPALARAATKLAAAYPHYRWCGSLPHGLARVAIKRADLLIHPSIMEGGANVIAEAVTCGTPVLASQMWGNIGMLGRDYPGYFPVRDSETLFALLQRCQNDQKFLATLAAACEKRALLFSPQREQDSLRNLVNAMLKGRL